MISLGVTWHLTGGGCQLSACSCMKQNVIIRGTLQNDTTIRPYHWGKLCIPVGVFLHEILKNFTEQHGGLVGKYRSELGFRFLASNSVNGNFTSLPFGCNELLKLQISPQLSRTASGRMGSLVLSRNVIPRVRSQRSEK